MTVATFYNYSPALHRYALPAAWDIATPAEVLAARFRGIQAVYERVEAPTDGLEELTALAERAAEGLSFAGRPLAAANADVPLPAQPFARAWQALAVLREYRGDGHIAALLVAELGPVEALALYAAWQHDRARPASSRRRAGGTTTPGRRPRPRCATVAGWTGTGR